MAAKFLHAVVSGAINKWRVFGADTTCGIRDTLAQLGAWQHLPATDSASKNLLRTALPRTALCVSAFVAFVMSPVSIYKFRDDDVLKLMEPTAALFIMSMLVVNIGSLLYRGDKFDGMMEALEQMKAFQQQHPPLDEATVEDIKWFSTFAFAFFTYAVPITWPGLLLGYPGFAIQQRDLSFRYWFPYDHTVSPNFDLTLLALTANLAFGGLVCLLSNSFLVSLLVDAINQLQLVKHNMANLCVERRDAADDVHRDSASNTPESGSTIEEDPSQAQRLRFRAKLMRDVQDAEHRLRMCISHHQAINRFVLALDEAFSLILIQLYANSVCPVVLGVIAVTHTTEFDSRSMIIAGLVVNQMIAQAVFCWLGETITQQSSLVREAMFGCNWFDQSESFKRSMRIIMSRSNQPLDLKIGRFIPLNLPTFYQIVQVTYSYYMSLTATLELKTVSD